MRPTVLFAALCLATAGCVAGPEEDGLYYAAPVSAGADFVATAKGPAEVAALLQEAGLGTVRATADGVTLSSRDLRLIDCGTYVQVTMGNRATFPATAPEAVLMEGFTTPGLVRRIFDSRSTVRLTRAADGSGYSVAETHSVTRRYQAVESRAKSVLTVTFDETGEASFPNGSRCRASGLVGSLLR